MINAQDPTIQPRLNQGQPPEVVVPEKSNKKKKILMLILLLILVNLVVIGTFYLATREKKISTPEVASLKREVKAEVSPAPFPFQEMTIPYLRSRPYQSSLGELEQAALNESYTSYLTSYDSDGLKINGQLTVPTGEKPEGGWPAVVFVHGYIPPQNYQTLVNYASFMDIFARRGYVILKTDLRGHGTSEGDPDGAYYSSDYVIDVLNAYAALQRSDLVNPKRIGLWGHSMAGNVVTRALGAKPDIPAVALWSGAGYTYQDLSAFSINDNSYQPPSQQAPSRQKRNEMFELYGSFNPSSDFWKQVPMTNYLEDIKGAISLYHTVDDPVVGVGYSRNLDSILDKTSIAHELNEYPSGGHNFTGATFNAATEKTFEFFDKHLK